MKVSVVIPAWNAEAVIGRAIESVLAQTLPVHEIVVVDDGSGDRTSRRAARYGERVKCIRRKNGGVAAARNDGISRAVGDWIAFLDSDDTWDAGKNEAQCGILEKDSALKWCCTGYETIPPQRQGVASPASYRSRVRKDGKAVFFQAARYRLPMCTSGFLIHRSLLRESGGFDTHYLISEDRDLWWRIAGLHPVIGYASGPLVRYFTTTPGSLMKSTHDRSDSIRVLIQAGERLNRRGEPDEDQRIFLRTLALGYLYRWAAGLVEIPAELSSELRRCFPVRRSEQAAMAWLRRVPRILSRKVALYLIQKAWEKGYRS